MNERRFEGRVAVVTGGTTGIGRATVERLHAEGASVIFCGRRQQVGDDLAATLASDRAVFVAADVTVRNDLEHLYDTCQERFGRLDVVVNNAGNVVVGPTLKLKPEQWRRTIALNLDLNFLSLTGALWAVGEADRPPVPPLILAGDFGGGGAFLALGMVSALWEASRSGQGQVVDAAIVDGALNLMAYTYGNLEGGTWNPERQSNLIDGGDWRYCVYTCSDGRFVSLAVIHPKFLDNFLGKAEVQLPVELGDPADVGNWPAYRQWMAQVIAARTRNEWVELFDADDDCVQPVLDLVEAPNHPHLQARESFTEIGGTTQPSPAPRFSRTPSEITRLSPSPGEGAGDVLRDWGFSDADIARIATPVTATRATEED